MSLPAVPPILDVEAPGFGAGSYPIEVGYFLGDGTAYCTLIKPAANWTHWDPAAEAVHGIDQLSFAAMEPHGARGRQGS